VNSLATYYSLYAQRFLNLAGIACRLEIPENLPEHPLDTKLRHGIFRAFKEALNNLVRHSGASEVQLKIEVAERCLSISIADNGCGFRLNGPIAGKDGIAGMRRRMDQLGGECHIYSGPGRGSLVRFRLPLHELPAAHDYAENAQAASVTGPSAVVATQRAHEPVPEAGHSDSTSTDQNNLIALRS
jgi:signal transduction histidine kinase